MKFLNNDQAKTILGGCCPGDGPPPEIPPPEQQSQAQAPLTGGG